MPTVKKIITDHQNLRFDYPYQDIYLLRLLQNTVGELVHHFEKEFSHFQLNDVRLLLLLAIRGQTQQGISPSELGNLFNISRVNITRQLDAMVKNGWVERRAHPSDRRSQLLFLTPEGLAFLNQIAAPLQEHLVSLLSDINQDEKAIFLNVLTKLHQKLTETNSPE